MELTLKDAATQVYEMGGMYYLRMEDRIFQFDYDYFLVMCPGNEVYEDRKRELRKLVPLPRGEGLSRLNILLKTIQNLKETI
jgi:hypothetical protein